MSDLAAVCFIACHGGPADHFSTFAESLPRVEVHASGPALKKFQERGIEVKHSFSIENISSQEEDALAEQIAKACAAASVVITDVGHHFDIKIQKALAQYAVQTIRLAYYDNPEPYVPGGYSAVAAEVMMASQGVLFANSNLAKTTVLKDSSTPLDFGDLKKVGIGYYPVHQAEKMAKRRASEHAKMREQLFLKHGVIDQGQKVLVYFGGNNDEYFTKAFPTFLSFLTPDLSEFVILVQQHPGAKAKNIEGKLLAKVELKAPKIILSDLSSDEAQIVADAALYYQTSMGPQFVLAGIPTLQVGHETYHDILVRNHLSPSVTSAEELKPTVIRTLEQFSTPQQKVILEGLGIRSDWLETLKTFLAGG